MRAVFILAPGLESEQHVVTLIVGLLSASQVGKHGCLFPLAGKKRCHMVKQVQGHLYGFADFLRRKANRQYQ